MDNYTRNNNNIDRFKNNVVKQFVKAMNKSEAMTYDIATKQQKKIQALYLLTDGRVGVRFYKKTDDPFNFEWTDYDIVACRISGAQVIIDSSEVYVHYDSFLSETPIMIFGNEIDEDGPFVAFKLDLRKGEMSKLSVTNRRDENKEKKDYKYFYQAINRWVKEEDISAEKFYDPGRLEGPAKENKRFRRAWKRASNKASKKVGGAA